MCSLARCVCRIVYLNVFVYEICSNMNLLPSMAVQCTTYQCNILTGSVRCAQIWVSLIHSTVHCTASVSANVEQRGAHKRKQLSQLIIIIIIYIHTTCTYIYLYTCERKSTGKGTGRQAGTHIPPINRPRMAKLKWGNINLNRIFSVCKIFRRWLIFGFIFLLSSCNINKP